MAVVESRSVGCKVNQYEMQALREMYEKCDGRWALLLTCCVTSEAERKSRRELHRLLRRHPDATILVTGCLVSLRPELFKSYERVVAIDNSSKLNLLKRRTISRFDNHARAFLKICDGCIHNCSYCVVCRVRSRFLSRPTDLIIREAEVLSGAGFREVVLVGVNLAAYGRDISTDLASLLRRLDSLALFPRIRLSSLEPHLVDEKLLDAICECRSVCAHFHLPLQSGSNAVLAHMRRPYRVEEFAALVERFRKIRDKPSITTDIIVGYPTETESDFKATLRFVQEIGFCRVHIFKFSPRPTTPAASLKPLPPEVVRERFHRLRKVVEETAYSYRRSLVGMRETYLPERDGLGMLERYVKARINGVSKKFCKVSVTGVEGEHLIVKAHEVC